MFVCMFNAIIESSHYTDLICIKDSDAKFQKGIKNISSKEGNIFFSRQIMLTMRIVKKVYDDLSVSP